MNIIKKAINALAAPVHKRNLITQDSEIKIITSTLNHKLVEIKIADNGLEMNEELRRKRCGLFLLQNYLEKERVWDYR